MIPASGGVVARVNPVPAIRGWIKFQSPASRSSARMAALTSGKAAPTAATVSPSTMTSTRSIADTVRFSGVKESYKKQARRWFQAGAETAEIEKPDLLQMGEETCVRYAKLLCGASSPKGRQRIGVIGDQPRRGACLCQNS
jgi:hypothetical protein